MPELNPEILYQPKDPYHYLFDNLPLKNLLRRQSLINSALDDVIAQTRDAIGTQGTMANRLNQSINPDGSLKTAAIDEAQHSIEEHTDSDTYVRMLKAESDKLELIADEATNLYLEIQQDDEGEDIATFDADVLRFVPSTSVSFEVDGNEVMAHLAYPAASAHTHNYDHIPVAENLEEPDYTNFKVNSISSPYIEGSLRVYINGVRLTASDSIYTPGSAVNDPWTLLSFTPDHTAGTFALSAEISEDDIIRIDYDISYI